MDITPIFLSGGFTASPSPGPPWERAAVPSRRRKAKEEIHEIHTVISDCIHRSSLSEVERGRTGQCDHRAGLRRWLDLVENDGYQPPSHHRSRGGHDGFRANARVDCGRRHEGTHALSPSRGLGCERFFRAGRWCGAHRDPPRRTGGAYALPRQPDVERQPHAARQCRDRCIHHCAG